MNISVIITSVVIGIVIIGLLVAAILRRRHMRRQEESRAAAEQDNRNKERELLEHAAEDEATFNISVIKSEADEATQSVALSQLLNDKTSDYPSTEDYELAHAHVGVIKARKWNRLLEQARIGNRASFKVLRKLSSEEGWYKYPADWNDIVAKMIKNPSADDFKGNLEKLESKLEYGDLRLMAIEALKEKSLLKAKMVLALVNDDDSYYQAEVGELLLTRLGEMVVDAWTETWSTTPTTVDES